MMPFVVAAVLAYVLSPLVRGLQRVCGQRLPRVIAVVVVVPCALVTVLLVQALRRKVYNSRDYEEGIKAFTEMLRLHKTNKALLASLK